MKSRTAKLLTAGVFILTAASLVFAGAARAEVIGRISAAEGNVDLLSSGRNEAAPVKGGEDISAGDVLRTKSASKAEITFLDKSVVTLSEKTRLEIKDYRVGLDGKRIAAVLSIDRGKIRAVVSRSPGKDNFLINTPNASGSIKGTDLVVAYLKSATSATVIDGSMSLSSAAAPEKKIEIKGGETSVILADNEPTPPRMILAMERAAHEKDTMIAKAPSGESAKAEGYSEPGAMNASIVNLSGSVKVKNGSSKTWHDAKVNETLKSGDAIETGKNGKAEIRVENGDLITLRQDSNFTITRIKKSDNGETESSFESKKGKLRAKVEKLKGISMFEVKTPTAVASVRGTILFLNISQNQTQSYFEQGNGVLKSLISGTIMNVPMDTSSTADGGGNVTDPVPQTEEQKSQWNEGWDINTGDGAEGYSPLGGDTAGGGTNDTESYNNYVFDDKPVTDIIGEPNGNNPEGEPEPGGGEEVSYLTGTVTGSFGYQDRSEDNFLDMSLISNAPLNSPWSGQIPVDVTETYANPGYRVVTGDVAGTGREGGEFFGWLGRIMQSWEAASMSIYIDPTGRAGWLGTAYIDPDGGDTKFDILSGTNSFDGNLAGSNSLYFTQVAQLAAGVEYPVEYGDGNGSLHVGFDNGNGYFDAGFDRQMIRIEGQDWGIWREAYYDGEYYNPNGLTQWNGVAGGDYKDGYFFSSIRGIDDGDGSFRMNLTGAYLDYYTLGAYFGTILAYEGEGIEATGVGGFIESPLSFSGDWGYDGGLYNDEGEGGMGWVGEQYGYIGSTVTDWWQADSFPITAIGEYYIDYGEEPFIWNTSIDSYNAENEDSTSLGGGAFTGYSIGIWKDGLMSDGSIYAFYAAPDGTTGLLKGAVAGAYSNLIEMWLAEGTLNRQEKDGALVVYPADLYYNIQWSEMPFVNFGGAFPNVAFQNNWLDEASLYSIYDSPWGIFNMEMSGYFDRADEGYTIPENGIAMGTTEDDYGLLIKSTDVSLNDEKVIGTLTGVAIDLGEGTISRYIGDLRGVYNDDYYTWYDEFGNPYNEYDGSTWIASGLGEWDKKRLAYEGFITGGPDGGTGSAFGYFDNWEYSDLYLDYENSYLNGVFGGSESPYNGPAEFAMVGEFENPDWNDDGTGYYKLWASDFYLMVDTSVAMGSIGGTDINNRLKGGLIGLYIRDVGDGDYRAGYIVSSDENGDPAYLTGDFYPSIGIYDALGKVTAYLDAPTEYSPDVILLQDEDALVGDYFENEINGDIRGDLYGDTLQLSDQNWGIWRGASGGWFDTEPSAPWNAFIADKGEDDYGSYYSLVSINGNDWENGGFSGNIHGYELSSTELRESSGFFLGDYDSYEGAWEALSLGVWVNNELAFSGRAEGGIKDATMGDVWFDEWDYPEDFSGSFNGLLGSINQDWKNNSFKTVAVGDYEIYNYADSYLVNSQIGSYNAYADDSTTLDGEGAFYGWAHAAIGNSAEGRLLDTSSGLRIAAIYVASDGNDGYNAGILRGPLNLDLYELPDEGDNEEGIWLAEGYITPTIMERDIDISPDQLMDSLQIEQGVLEGSGTGAFLGGEIINQVDNQLEMLNGDKMSIAGPDRNWGIMQALLVGRAEAATVVEPTWNMAVGGTSYDAIQEVPDGYYLVSARGDVFDTTFNGTFRGVYFGLNDDDDTFNVGRTTGDVVGIYQPGEGEVDTTFQAQMLGEWVDLAQMTAGVNGMFDQVAIADMISIPITETYTALLSQTGSIVTNGTISNMTMDMSLYTGGSEQVQQIWTALFSGNYTGTPDAGWQVNLATPGYSATLDQGTWNPAENTWTASVSGTAPDSVSFTGQAGGTLADGSLQGVGAGTWTQP